MAVLRHLGDILYSCQRLPRAGESDLHHFPLGCRVSSVSGDCGCSARKRRWQPPFAFPNSRPGSFRGRDAKRTLVGPPRVFFVLALSWRSFAYGIAFGMGIFSTVDLAIEGMRVWGGFVAGYAFDFVAMATYHCCVMMWMAYLWIPETSRQIMQDLPENDVEQWNAELQRLLLQ